MPHCVPYNVTPTKCALACCISLEDYPQYEGVRMCVYFSAALKSKQIYFHSITALALAIKSRICLHNISRLTRFAERMAFILLNVHNALII